jgi:hypothetical protein
MGLLIANMAKTSAMVAITADNFYAAIIQENKCSRPANRVTKVISDYIVITTVLLEANSSEKLKGCWHVLMSIIKLHLLL